MRLNPDYFDDGLPDELPKSFTVIQNLDELKGEAQQELKALQREVQKMVQHELDKNLQKMDSPKDVKHTAVISYLGFQSLQIHMLQKEIQSIHQMLLMMAKDIDRKADQ